MKKLLLPFVLLSVNSLPCFSNDLTGVRKELEAYAAPETMISITGLPDAAPVAVDPAVDPSPLTEQLLREEAAADPDTFIDERTPEEVGIAFGLYPSRFQITDPVRIQNAAVLLTVDLSRQRLLVKSPSVNTEYKISSGVPGHLTPGSGRCYSPDTMELMHHSSLYNNAPMPHSVFFNGNIAVHATSAKNEAFLGRQASHGCVRLSRENATVVYGLIAKSGKSNAVICVKGSSPRGN
ncbi:MAG: L,D-transpeptidase, partial [Elusimicrobiales bacterium]